jgi:signal transduction histidine kinase
MEQERKLEASRLAEDRQRALDRLRQDLLSELEKAKLEQMTRAAAREGGLEGHPEGPVVFVGEVKDGNLLLPWENNPAARKFRDGLRVGAFAEKIREAESLELVAHRNEDAAKRYRAATDSTEDPSQRSYARLSFARALQKASSARESQAEFQRVLEFEPDLVDEHGVPFGLYAAAVLIQTDEKPDEIDAWIRFAADGERVLPSEALRIARNIAEKAGATDYLYKITDRIRDSEQADALQRDFSRLIPAVTGHNPVWIAFGAPPWLVSVTPPVGAFDGLLVAVRAGDVLDERIRIATAADAGSQPLGESFPGLRVVMPQPEEPGTGSRQSFLAAALILAVAFTIVAGFLLWRDVQRDLRLSEMRSQFVSSVSHELRSPLSAIRMFTETLKLDEDVDRETRSEYLDTILHESERLSRLVDNVLDFGKIERGKKTYRFQAVRLDEIVGNAARTAQYPLEQAGFTLDTHIEPGIPPISADSDALQQAILNLLSNAMKYSGDSRRIDLRLDRVNGNARIHVVDHGIGIAPGDQKHIFERFYRAPAAENAHIPGTGLGLTIASHIAKAHGGNVAVTSTPGSGSTFTIELPLPTEPLDPGRAADRSRVRTHA